MNAYDDRERAQLARMALRDMRDVAALAEIRRREAAAVLRRIEVYLARQNPVDLELLTEVRRCLM